MHHCRHQRLNHFLTTAAGIGVATMLGVLNLEASRGEGGEQAAPAGSLAAAATPAAEITRGSASPARRDPVAMAVRFGQPAASPISPAPVAGRTIRRAQAVVSGRLMPVAAGEILVSLRDRARLADDAQALAAGLGSRVLQVGSYSGLVRLAVPAGRSMEDFAAQAKSAPQVADARPNVLCFGTVAFAAGYDPRTSAELYSSQWHLQRIDVEGAWRRAGALSAVTVAVLDSGVAYEDYSDASGTYARVPSLAPVPISQGYDFVNDDEHANDDNQHGTHLAVTIAGAGEVSGVAPGVGIMPVKVLDSELVGTELTLAEAVLYAVDNGADVINLSLSFPAGYLPGIEVSAAIAFARESGVSVVAAAGNDGADEVAYPAAYVDVVAVGATHLVPQGNRLVDAPAAYSNRGYAIDVTAPGGDLDEDVNQDGIPDGVLAETFSPHVPSDIGYWVMTGTSPATAEVAGVVAMLHGLGVPAASIPALLREHADGRNGPWGYSEASGGGLLDAARAVQKAPQHRQPPPRVFANPFALLVTRNGQRLATAVVEVIDEQDRPLRGATVFGHFVGDVVGSAKCRTGVLGICAMDAVAVGTDASVFGFAVDVVRNGSRLLGPVGFARIDTRSYRLMASLGTGLGTSSITFGYGSSIRSGFGYLTRGMSLEPQLFFRVIGAGLAEGAIALTVLESAFLNHPESSEFVPLVSNGLGLSLSPLSWDSALFSPAVLAEPNPPLIVRAYTAGTGLGTSAIRFHGRSVGFDYWNTTLDLGVGYLNSGAGLGTSTIIFNRGLWNPSRYFGSPVTGQTYAGTGLGLASSVFVFDYAPQTFAWLGLPEPGELTSSNWLVTETFIGRGLGTSTYRGHGLGTSTARGRGLGTSAFWGRGVGTSTVRSRGLGTSFGRNVGMREVSP